MAYCIYILYSKALDKYYIGYTQELELRVKQHNEGFYKKVFTRIANDWQVFHTFQVATKKQAILIEAHIKKMKSRTYLQNLKQYPEIVQKLLNNY